MPKKELAFRRKTFKELTDSQWQILEKIVDPTKRKRKICLRMVLNRILWMVHKSVTWRDLDITGVSWETYYYYFLKWQKDGTLKEISMVLHQKVRVEHGREAEASAVAVDSQSVKKGPLVAQDTGIDGGKNVNGRKRHIAVDSLGLPLAVVVTAANVHDGQAGLDLLWQMEEASKRIELIRADHSYQGYFVEAASYYGWKVEISQKPESKQGFVPQKGRWFVERSFAWLNFFRRLAKDYEKTAASATAFNQLAFISLILSKIQT
jgi:putative transposase